MGRTFSFRDYMLKYDCPFCGKPQSGLEVEQGLAGQSILWIALECIRAGAALSPCRSCGKSFAIPASVFADGVLAEFQSVSALPGDRLWEHVTKNYVATGMQSRLLLPDWYDILLEANRAGPVDTMRMQWDPSQPCPNCGSRPHPHPITFTYACPFCACHNTVAQQDIHESLGVRVACRGCLKALFVPPRVWCPKCKRALVDYHEVLRHIADENGVDVTRLQPR